MRRNNSGAGSRNSAKKIKKVEQQRKPNPAQSSKQANLKQFKMEIDSQIEKCLDQLDKQGLKYLKQTLKNSNIFNEQISEIIAIENNKPITKSPTKIKNSDQIQEEIVEQYEYFQDKYSQPSKQKTFLGSNNNKPLREEIPIKVKLQKFQNKIQQPLKPFAKRVQSRQDSHQQKAVIIEKSESKALKEEQQIKDKSQIDLIVEKINQLPQQKLKKLGQIIQRLEKSQKFQQQQFSGLKTKPYILKPDQTVSNPSSMKSSSHKLKKNEKATSLYNQIMKPNKKSSPFTQKQQNQNPKYEHHDEQLRDQNEISEEISQVQIQSEINKPKNMDIPDRMIKYQNSNSSLANLIGILEQKQDQKSNQSSISRKSGSQNIKKGSFLKNFPISNIKKPLDIEVTQSHQADTLQLNQGNNSSKMVRVGKKKLGTNKVKLVLLRNRGHPSIIGLTCVQFYNINGKIIPISIQNIKSQSGPKLLKLFNGIFNTINEQEMFTAIFKRDYEIELEIPEKIGGIKIWNYNKSEIESSKETDWIQVYINDKLSWQGLIKKGSYNEITDYCTEAQIDENFKFQNIKNELNQINQTSLNLENNQGSGFYIGKAKEKDAPKVDWLQKTLMEQKIKKIEEQEKNKQTTEFRKTGNKVNRFSQIYQDEEGSHKNLNIGKKQQREEKKIELNFKQKQPQPLQRVSRTNSKRIEEEKDIFSNFGQNFIKQKIKSNEINAKMNEISEKIQKLKQTYKQQQFGYSSLINKSEGSQKKINKIQPKVSLEIKEKKNYQKQSLDDFMNDSIFQEPGAKKEKKIERSSSRLQKQTNRAYLTNKVQQKNKIETNENANKVDIDDFLNQLNDLVGSKENRYQFGNEKQKFITIPELPKGSKMEILFISNWGDVQFIGINKIQFFDSQGLRAYPSEVKSNIQSSSVTSIFSQSKGYLLEQSDQWKCQKKQQIKISIVFSKKIQFSLIRFWNFIGDRVHSMIGVKKIQILLEGSLIFVGDLRKNAGHSRDQIYKSCESILFTNNVIIQKRILQNDWLNQQYQIEKQETIIFKKTLQNFMRPLTNGLSQKQIKLIQNKQGIKLPKRNCFQYDPPTLPSGYYIKLILHTTWGDRDFIGLNGIQIFDEKGLQITDVKKITQFPAPLVTLSGYEKDKRILNNLFNGKNLTSNDQSIWLAPYLLDIDKMQKQAQNAILIEFDKICTFSAINLYNYAKTPKRGVREIEIYVDNYLVYRGYLRIANAETGEILTTINFTKDPATLQKIGYAGYNQDNLGQQVNFYNEGKAQKAMF